MNTFPSYSKKSITLIFAAILAVGFGFSILSVPSQALAVNSNYVVIFDGRTLDHQNNTSTWSYTVYKIHGDPALSHWIWQPCFSEEELSERFVSATPPADAVGLDGSTLHYGVKWNIPDGFDWPPSGATFTVTITGQPAVDYNGAIAVIKAGQTGDHNHGAQPHFDLIIPGPSCEEPPEPYCGDGNVDCDEECDDRESNGVECTPDYGSSCTYCSEECEIIELEGSYCGDGNLDEGYEECDGQDGVDEHQTCSQECTLIDLTYCGDGIKQSPNDEETGGPQDDGYEDCDDTDGVGENQACTRQCVLIDLEHCGDGIKNGDEECDGTDGVPEHYTCTDQCTLEYIPYCGDGNLDEGEECEIGHECYCPEDYICNLQTCLCEEEECIPEGGSGVVVPGELECCEGLIQIGCDQPDQYGNCIDECVGAFYCTNCGDGICGLGENKCNCPEDCEEEPEVLTILAWKVVCEAEEDLPNWATSGTQAGEPSLIIENTAQDYVTASNNKCWLEANWDFQWGFNGQVQKQAGDHTGPAPDGTGWNDFDFSTGTDTPAQVQISELNDTLNIWVRENLKENYIPFANPPGDLQDNVSAEILCHDDILNYDNYDFISSPQLEETYYCVAFNALIEEWPECTPEETQSCDTGLLGICAAGTKTCDQDGFWGECVQDEEPVAEICDDGLDNNCDGDTDCDDEGCFQDPVCQEPVCGNGVLEGEEECDDGNTEDGDGCSAICEIEGIQPEDIIINEIMQNPEESITDNDGEWFELYNITNREIDLESCLIKDSDLDSHTIGSSLIISAGGYVVLARNGNSGENGGVTPNYVYSSFILANTADEIILECDETEIDRVEYDGGPNFPDPEGASMILADPSFDNNIGSNWCVSYSSYGDGDLGTPGVQNDSCDVGTAIIGCKYNDANNNSQIDPEEERLSGWTIVLEKQNGGNWEEIAATTTQEGGDDHGCYLFDGLEAGNYRVSEILTGQISWTQTYPSGLSHIVSLDKNQTLSNIDFANYYLPVCGNGILDDEEECDDGNTEDGDDCSASCTIEEQPGCEPGDTQLCNTGQFGICALGTQTCTELAVWGECVRNEEPVSEICNDGLDNDCDGSTDCGDGDCASYPACQGGPGPDPLIIFNEKIEEILDDTVIVTWSTTTYATSRVVYDTVSHSTLSDPPNYGYTYSTSEDVNKVKSHRVIITGLAPDTAYFWRPISHRSWPEVLGDELTFNLEEPECEPEETQSCDTGLLGICTAGTQTCDQDGYWGECVQDEESVAEVCDDGLDNNCDGDTDCDDSVCVSDPFCIEGGPECTLGEIQSCNTGLLGICALGTQTCIQGGFWGECMQNNSPVSEICDNGLDDDCDGYVDEADPNCAGPGPVCTNYYKDSDADGYGITDNSQCLTEPTGDYIVTQTGDCDDNNPEINPGIIEVCDNQIDDDCDEDIDCNDEDCAESQICTITEELEEKKGTGLLNSLLAAVGNFYSLKNICLLLIIALAVLIALFYLTKKGIKKEDENSWLLLLVVTSIAIIVSFLQNYCWFLLIPIILIIILLILDRMKEEKKKKEGASF